MLVNLPSTRRLPKVRPRDKVQGLLPRTKPHIPSLPDIALGTDPASRLSYWPLSSTTPTPYNNTSLSWMMTSVNGRERTRSDGEKIHPRVERETEGTEGWLDREDLQELEPAVWRDCDTSTVVGIEADIGIVPLRHP